MIYSLLKRHKIILFGTMLVLTITIIGLSRFVALMQTKKDKVIAAKEHLAAYEENKKIFSEESSALAVIKNRLITFESYRITPSTTPALLSSLESMARKDGIEFSITTVQTADVQNSGKKLLIDFTAKGSSERIDVFLKELTHQIYQVKFTKFTRFIDGGTIADPTATMVPTKKMATRVAIPQWALLVSIEIASY